MGKSRRRILRISGSGLFSIISVHNSTSNAATTPSESETPTENRSATTEQPTEDDPGDSSPEVWMHPTPFSDPLTELGGNPESWEWVREHVTGVEWNGAMNVVHQDAGGQSFVDTLVDAGSGIGMSVGGPDRRWEPFDQNFGERAAAGHSPLLEGVENLGGQVDHINIDGPVKRVLHGFDWEDSTDDPPSVDRIAEELVDFVASIRAEHGDVTPWIITNFPNWGWKGSDSITHREWGDYYDVFPVIVEEFHARDVPLEGVMVDHPLRHGGKERLLDLRREAHSRDVRFNMIINSALGGGASDGAFSRRTLEYLKELQEMDLNPDRYTIQSWYDHPEQNIPESDRSTMTGLTRAVLERPYAVAGEDRTVAEGMEVELDGTESRDHNDNLSYTWEQTTGPAISLRNSETATPEFTAPDVSSVTDITFELTINGGRATDTDTITVTTVPEVTDYTNDEGIVDIAGVRDALTDWRDGDIETPLLQKVIDVSRSDGPIK